MTQTWLRGLALISSSCKRQSNKLPEIRIFVLGFAHVHLLELPRGSLGRIVNEALPLPCSITGTTEMMRGFFQFFPSCNLTQEGFSSKVTSKTGLLNSGRCKYIKIHLTIMLYCCSLCIYFFRSKSRIKYLNGYCIGKCLEWEVWELRSNFYCKVFKLKISKIYRATKMWITHELLPWLSWKWKIISFSWLFHLLNNPCNCGSRVQ